MESDLQEKIVIMTEAAEELNKTIEEKEDALMFAENEVAKLSKELEEKEDALMFAENEVAKLSKELDETIQASEAVVKQWKGTYNIFES